jgi:DNA-binding CsgD family transcriptional regulator
MAQALNISSKTVGTHLQKIYKKVGVGKLQELLNKIYQ